MPPPGYLEGVRALCDKYGLMFIADEVMAGFGRTGKWFAFEHFGVTPDLITFAKGSNSGYVPVGGVVISDPIAATFDERVFPGGLTYSGHPLAAASIVASIDAMKEERHRRERGARRRDVLGPGLRELAERHPVIGEVRGLGVFWAARAGLGPGDPRAMLAPYGGSSPAMNELVAEAKKRGAAAVHQLQPDCTSSRRARSPRPRPRRAWPSSTRSSRWSTGTTPGERSPEPPIGSAP